MLRRLLHDLEERVEALRGHHVRFVENEDLVAVSHRGEPSPLPQFTGVVHAVVARRVNLHHVDRPGSAGRQIPAAVAFAARVRGGALHTVDAPCQNARGTRFAASSRPGEQVCVGELVLIQGVHEGHGNLVLPDHPFEGVGPIPAIQRQCHVYPVCLQCVCPSGRHACRSSAWLSRAAYRCAI